ncbi:unnamed protein product [Ostreobium quekettii]|uniref:Uncharacterized protein n=1 Tax=Ostreobium quekettii TaxID=121088 RepID=A0A8S1IX65_9CHLO|nr:unnamed protein product [Ostreobium quekettii]
MDPILTDKGLRDSLKFCESASAEGGRRSFHPGCLQRDRAVLHNRQLTTKTKDGSVRVKSQWHQCCDECLIRGEQDPDSFKVQAGVEQKFIEQRREQKRICNARKRTQERLSRVCEKFGLDMVMQYCVNQMQGSGVVVQPYMAVAELPSAGGHEAQATGSPNAAGTCVDDETTEEPSPKRQHQDMISASPEVSAIDHSCIQDALSASTRPNWTKSTLRQVLARYYGVTNLRLDMSKELLWEQLKRHAEMRWTQGQGGAQIAGPLVTPGQNVPVVAVSGIQPLPVSGAVLIPMGPPEILVPGLSGALPSLTPLASTKPMRSAVQGTPSAGVMLHALPTPLAVNTAPQTARQPADRTVPVPEHLSSGPQLVGPSMLATLQMEHTLAGVVTEQPAGVAGCQSVTQGDTLNTAASRTSGTCIDPAPTASGVPPLPVGDAPLLQVSPESNRPLEGGSFATARHPAGSLVLAGPSGVLQPPGSIVSTIGSEGPPLHAMGILGTTGVPELLAGERTVGSEVVNGAGCEVPVSALPVGGQVHWSMSLPSAHLASTTAPLPVMSLPNVSAHTPHFPLEMGVPLPWQWYHGSAVAEGVPVNHPFAMGASAIGVPVQSSGHGMATNVPHPNVQQDAAPGSDPSSSCPE